MPEAYIVEAVRSACGRRNGRLAGWHPVDLAAEVLDALVERSGIDPDVIDDVIMGCVQQAGEQSSNIGRNAVLASKLPGRIPGTSVDRQCGSSQQALQFAAQAVMSGTMDVVIAAGVEAMTRIPMLAPMVLAADNGLGDYMSPRIQARFGVREFSQFTGAEMIAEKYGHSKDSLDEYAYQTTLRAVEADKAGRFRKEIVPIAARSRDGVETGEVHQADEGIRHEVTREGIAGVRLLKEGGRITAATSSQISDGSSALLVVSEKALKLYGLTPLARIHHMTVLGGDPVIMLEAPVEATELALRRAGMKIDEIDLYEVNEAFAPVPMCWLEKTGADPARLNVNGGAIAIGHPLGASGGRIMTTLVHALHDRQARYGLQTMCEGGGLANVTIIERC